MSIRITLLNFLLLLSLTGCMFETQTTFSISPDLSNGQQWLYESREFLKTADGNSGDTIRHFIHYQIMGDTLLGRVTYKLLQEKRLILFNTDYGLLEQISLMAVEASDNGVVVRVLKNEGGNNGRLPFKKSALDTTYFMDEFRTLDFPLRLNCGWEFRKSGSPDGSLPVKKTCLGLETIPWEGRSTEALKFQFEIIGMEFLKTFEWYIQNTKVLTQVKAAANNPSIGDTLFFEDVYLGARKFLRADTEAIMKRFQ